MQSYLKNHNISASLLGALSILAVVKAFAATIDGYCIILPFYLAVFLLDLCAPILAVIAAAFTIVSSIISREVKFGLTVAWIAAILLMIVPGGHFQAIGAWLAVLQAGPVQVRDDARELMEKSEPMTYFGPTERPPFNKPLAWSQLPASLRAAHLEAVLVLKDYVFLGKYGTTALLRGYVVFREGADVWKDEPSITLLDGCGYCWRIRIVDGLYWYHGVPKEEEIPTFVTPLQ